jgi:hypothetical protein
LLRQRIELRILDRVILSMMALQTSMPETADDRYGILKV